MASEHQSRGAATPETYGSVLLELQNTILEMIARDDSLGETCKRLCEDVEALVPDVLCSVLAVDKAGQLRPLAGPSLSDAYSSALDGVPIGPAAGSCGTSAYLGVDVVVIDIETDPRWAQFRHLALPHGLMACWSSPIVDAHGVTVATFAFYYRERRGPTAFERDVVRNCVRLCLIAIDRHERILEQERRAFSDALTALPNRAAFNTALSQLECAEPGRWALLVLDLDNLKVVNDTFGHAAGDRLLQIAGERIAAAIGPCRVFRIGGDEFAIVIDSSDALRDLDLSVQTILDALAVPADCGGPIVVPRATIGGAVLSPGDIAVDRVRQNADFALYHAKETGRGGFVRYWPGLGSTMTRRLSAIQDVNAALSEHRIDAYYQPIFRLDTREIVGLEALCRMRIGDRVVAAANFHEATKDVDVATALTARMIALVAADLRRWLEMGIPFQHVGINVSSADLCGGSVERVLTAAFDREGVPLHHVILEITETVYMGDGDHAVQTAIRALRDLGIRIALDDFGTGFASLTHLLTVPIDIIKIDKTFIDHLVPETPVPVAAGVSADGSTDGSMGANVTAVSMTIVEGLIRIAERMNIRIVAEGVETDRQARWLQSAGCVLGQGYVHSPAVDRDRATALLLEGAQYRGAMARDECRTGRHA